MFRKNKLLLYFLIVLLSFAFQFESVYAAKVTYEIKATQRYEIAKGEKLKLYLKGHKNNKGVTWKSSKNKVASVSSKGVVKGKKGGTTTITAKYKKKKYKCKVTVIVGEKTKYDKDVSPEKDKDRYDSINVDKEENKKPTYNEWLSAEELEKYGVSFIYGSSFAGMDDKIIHITSNAQGISVPSVNIELPENMENDIVYGSDIRFMYDGEKILYNSSDLINLKILQ